MANIINFPHRHFRIWIHTVSHKQLLIRSTKDQGLSTRVDVLFVNVGAIHLPAEFDGLTVSEAADGETPDLHVLFESSAMSGQKIFVISGSNFKGYVIAAAVGLHEAALEYCDPSHWGSLPGDYLNLWERWSNWWRLFCTSNWC